MTTTTKTPALKDCKVGDVLVANWGYSMIIVQFFEIVGRRGSTIFQLRELKRQQISGDPGWNGRVTPRAGDYMDPSPAGLLEARISRKSPDAVRTPGPVSVLARAWNGQPQYFDSAD